MSGVRKTVKGLLQMQGIASNSLFTYAKYVFLSENFACDSEMNGAKGDLLCFWGTANRSKPGKPTRSHPETNRIIQNTESQCKKGTAAL